MKKHRLLQVFALLLVLLAGGCFLYIQDYYRADSASIAAFSPAAAYTLQADGTLTVGDPTADTGLIFYPGGKVEHTAYLPLMEAIAQGDVFCVLPQMPLRLAVFDQNAADIIVTRYPGIGHWYLGGHSLGGAMAASYAASHGDQVEGLLLLGAYSTADLRDTGLKVSVVYGSQDRVMNREKYEACRENLPADFQETVISGGCHAYFGMYGPQKGDGTPTISNEEQIRQTARIALELMK